MSEGFVYLHRKLMQGDIWTASDQTLRMMITCLLMANWQDHASGIFLFGRCSVLSSAVDHGIAPFGWDELFKNIYFICAIGGTLNLL